MKEEARKILMEVAKTTSPTAMMILNYILQSSKECSFIRDDSNLEFPLLFDVKHDNIRKKVGLKKSIDYWCVFKQLEDSNVVKKHFITLTGCKERLYISIHFDVLSKLVGKE